MEKTRISSRAAVLLPLVFLFVAPFAAVAQAAGASGAAGSSAAPNNSNSIVGTIVSVKGATFVISLADGTQKTILLRDGALILDREVATADQIKAGDALGVAARLDNGSLVATSINIFAPEMWDNIRKGQFPMATGETMTNAMTAQVIQNKQGRVLSMKFDMGTAMITLPDGIPIHRLLAVKVDQLTAGLKVMIRTMADANGNLTATGVSFDQPTRG